MKNIAVMLFLILPLVALAHGDEEHLKDSGDEWETITEEISSQKLKQINDLYLAKIKPIFKNKCLDCHGTGNPLPWYASIPGPKHLVLDDIKKARTHMDMSNDFPFSGHGTPEDDLEALAKTVKEGSMPPLRYKVIHWSAPLNRKEKKVINQWIVESLKVIKTKPEEKK